MPSTEDDEPGSTPYAHRRAWGPSARISARIRLTKAIKEHNGLLDVSTAAATVVCEELAARTVTVTLLQHDFYRDLVKVGTFGPDEQIDASETFPASQYPKATARLLAQQAYVSSEQIPDIEQEHLQIVSPNRVSAFMGVPIVADGEVRGEIFATRRAGEPAFTKDDVDVARDFATQLGSQFPRLLAESQQGSDGSETPLV